MGGLYRAKFPKFGPIGRKAKQDLVSDRETGTELRFAMEGPGFCRAPGPGLQGQGSRVGAWARVGAPGPGPVSFPLIHAGQ